MKLSEFELTVMQLLWQTKQASAPELHQQVIAQKDVTYSTVKTIIDRLEKKGAITRSEKIGKTIFYKTVVSPKDIQKPMFKSMLNHLFGGNKKQLMNHLFDSQELDQNDIDYLEQLIQKNKKSNKNNEHNND
ncbi:BlaI/MecI/CopY family transcriptional regulator [Marinicella rhabdoformis]|uniref:BlaI/MecI/CopY family transcriptional regulator n=1 Tax=Marinicella rhabdoformis TaxID=2580566 RepID=UPI0012AEBF5C|nr:BlaI/MecI/CopY family transcriptional regulator [Marinicella rhabdoformis]